MPDQITDSQSPPTQSPQQPNGVQQSSPTGGKRGINKVLIAISVAVLIVASAATLILLKPKPAPVIYGKWATDRGAMFDFTIDNRYGWYKSKDDLSDNYYKGPLEMLSGEKAMEDLGITAEEYDRVYKEFTATENNIFSVKMRFEQLHSGGVDKNDIANKDDFYYYAFFVSDENPDEAIVVNVAEGTQMKVTKIK